MILQARTHDHNSYILEQPSSWSTLRIHPSWPQSRLRLGLLLVSLSKCISCLSRPIQYLAVCPNGSDFNLTPSLLSERLLTDVQVNNITTLHDTHGHTYIHHISITILLLFYTSSTLLGRLAGPGPSRLTQFFPIFSLCIAILVFSIKKSSKVPTERNIFSLRKC